MKTILENILLSHNLQGQYTKVFVSELARELAEARTDMVRLPVSDEEIEKYMKDNFYQCDDPFFFKICLYDIKGAIKWAKEMKETSIDGILKVLESNAKEGWDGNVEAVGDIDFEKVAKEIINFPTPPNKEDSP